MPTPPADESYEAPPIVAIGASGGAGLTDLKTLLAALPPTLPAVVLVVLHQSSEQVSHLRAVLALVSALPVVTAGEGDHFQKGTCYVGEAAAHLTLAAKSRVELVDGAEHRYRNRTVDLLFASVAAHARRRAIGVVLAGSLDDGSRGLAAIHDAGGATMVIASDGVAQAGMPANAARYDGPIDVLGTAREIAAAIAKRVGEPAA